MRAQTLSKRLQLTAKDGKKLFYDIDPDNTVYWLRPRSDNKLQRYRVLDHELAEELRRIVARTEEEMKSNESTS